MIMAKCTECNGYGGDCDADDDGRTVSWYCRQCGGTGEQPMHQHSPAPESTADLREKIRDMRRDQQELARCWQMERCGLETRIKELQEKLERTKERHAKSQEENDMVEKAVFDEMCNRVKDLEYKLEGLVARVALAEEGVTAYQKGAEVIHKMLSDANVPTNGEEGIGKRQSLTLEQRIKRFITQNALAPQTAPDPLCGPTHFAGCACHEAAHAARVAELEVLIQKLREKVEFERMRLAACGVAACGVAALSNTEESAKKQRIERGNPYRSASYGDVCAAVDREMELRDADQAELTTLREQVTTLREALEFYAPPTFWETKAAPSLPSFADDEELIDGRWTPGKRAREALRANVSPKPEKSDTFHGPVAESDTKEKQVNSNDRACGFISADKEEAIYANFESIRDMKRPATVAASDMPTPAPSFPRGKPLPDEPPVAAWIPRKQLEALESVARACEAWCRAEDGETEAKAEAEAAMLYALAALGWSGWRTEK